MRNPQGHGSPRAAAADHRPLELGAVRAQAIPKIENGERGTAPDRGQRPPSWSGRWDPVQLGGLTCRSPCSSLVPEILPALTARRTVDLTTAERSSHPRRGHATRHRPNGEATNGQIAMGYLCG